MVKTRYITSLIIGSFFSFIICLIDPFRVMVTKGASMTSDYSIGAAFFYFYLIVIINSIVGKINKKYSLESSELVIIFGMMAVSCAIPTWGLGLNLIPLLPGVYYYAEPHWKENFLPYINKKITVSDENAIKWFFEGLPEGCKIPWDKWIGPLFLWFLLIFSIYLFSIFLMYFFSRRWIEEERLLYPLTIPPEELAKKGNAFPLIIKNKLFNMGILVSFLLLSFYCLHTYFPSIPAFILYKKFRIFRRIVSVEILIALEVISFVYFIPLDVSLGIWLAYWFYKIQTGIFSIIGFSRSSPEPWVFAGIESGYECIGAMFAMILIMFWQERYYLKNVFSDRKNLPYTIGCIICFLIVLFWLRFIGLKFIHSLIFTIFTFLIFIGITRVVCQTGIPYARSSVVPAGMLINILGTEQIGTNGLTALGFTSPWACDLRTLVMTSSANFFALGEKFKINSQKIIIACIIAVLISIPSCFFSIIRNSYKYGGINLGGWQFTSYVPYTLNWIKEYLLHPYHFGKYEFSFFSIGAFLYILLNFLRLKLPGFPIHPIGLTIAATVPIYFTWFSIFIGWFLKFLILRYGGQKIYKLLQPFFLGVIIGTFLTAGIWMFIDFITGKVPGTMPIVGS